MARRTFTKREVGLGETTNSGEYDVGSAAKTNGGGGGATEP